MQIDNIGTLKQCCKDEKSFEKVRQIVEELVEERNQKARAVDLLESVIRDDYDGILITDLNLEKPGPKIVYVNDRFCEMTGYSKEELIGNTPRILQGPKTDQAVLDKLKKRLSKGQSFFGQTVNYRKDGSEFLNQWDIHPLKDDDGNITHWVSYQHDISERKRAEEFLVDQKVEFDGLREESKRTIVDVDLEGNIVMANKLFRELVGYTKDELKRYKVWDFFPDKFMNSLRGRFEQQKDTNFDGREFRGIIHHKSGIPIQVKGSTRILDLKDQKIIRAEIENISLRKRIMNTLEKRNDNYSKLVERASEYTYKLSFNDKEPTFIIFSEEFPRITGLSHDAVVGKGTAAKFIHEEDMDGYLDHLWKIQQGETSTCEYRLRKQDGEYIEVADYCKPEWDDEKKAVVGAQCSVSLDQAFKKAVARP